MHEQMVLVIGEVFVDTHLDITSQGIPLVRLGGIFHAARAFSALGVPYTVAYYAPNYLDDDIKKWSCQLNAKGCYKMGQINCAPNVMFVRESTEAGDQGYGSPLRDQAEFIDCDSPERIIETSKPTDILIFPGRYDAVKIVKAASQSHCRLHIDANYDSAGILSALRDADIESLIFSTSSRLFIEDGCGTFSELIERFKGYRIQHFLLKENRGGAICYCSDTDTTVESAAYSVPAVHSVGVGDVYDAIFISRLLDYEIKDRMRRAALCAAYYAATVDYAEFETSVRLIRDHFGEWSTLAGIRLSWEKRKDCNIYLAAPDFPNVDTKPLDVLYHCLRYHNFSPRRPIFENGLITNDMDTAVQLEAYRKDVLLLDECSLLIAVLLNNDPGTLVELGMFKQAGKPTIIYDPFHCCSNMFVRHTPERICYTISDVIDATYAYLGEKRT